MADKEVLDYLDTKRSEVCHIERCLSEALDTIENMETFNVIDTRTFYPMAKQDIEGLIQFFGREIGKFSKELEEIVEGAIC